MFSIWREIFSLLSIVYCDLENWKILDPEISYQKVLHLFVQEISRKYLNFCNYRNELDLSLKTFLSSH